MLPNLNQGLDAANYETVVAIVKGHLKSHPEDYVKIIQVIDEATLPPVLVKTHTGKSMSWGVVLAINEVNKTK